MHSFSRTGLLREPSHDLRNLVETLLVAVEVLRPSDHPQGLRETGPHGAHVTLLYGFAKRLDSLVQYPKHVLGRRVTQFLANLDVRTPAWTRQVLSPTSSCGQFGSSARHVVPQAPVRKDAGSPTTGNAATFAGDVLTAVSPKHALIWFTVLQTWGR